MVLVFQLLRHPVHKTQTYRFQRLLNVNFVKWHSSKKIILNFATKHTLRNNCSNQNEGSRLQVHTSKFNCSKSFHLRFAGLRRHIVWAGYFGAIYLYHFIARHSWSMELSGPFV